MISEQWQRVKDVLGAVDGLSAAERERALDELCRGDNEVRREVDSLLEQEDRIELLSEPIDVRPWFGSEPRQAGPYRIERLVGAGGMGAVYLARRSDEVFEKQVAVKVIQCMGGYQLGRRFRMERQILATLEHSTIARLLDGGTLDDGRPYLVMEYVEGLRIDEYVDQGNLEIDKILELFLKVCAGVQYAHQNLVVHRDLKPGNVLVTPAGEPRLLDFGIARLLKRTVDTGLEETRSFERLLTPAAASPEQLSGGTVTTASDVYSLGLLLYRLLTGVSPYEGARNFRTDPNAVVLHYDPPLASNAPGLSPQRARALRGDLEMILARALEKEVSRRYQTVRELAAEIQRSCEGRPITARANSQLYVARRFIRRNRFAVAAASLVALSLAGGLTGTLVYARRAEREKELAIKRLDTVRRISESLLFDFHDSIKDLPGATPARALIVRRAQQYLDQVAAQDSSDPAVQRDLAAAYIRIGNLLSGERGPHIGGVGAMNTAITGYERALAIRRHLVNRHPEDPALRTELLESLWAVSYAYSEVGRLREAIDLQNERLRLIEASPQKDTFSLQYSLGATYSALSEMYRTLGDYGQALAFAQRALDERAAMVRQYPGNDRAERALGLSYNMVGYALASEEHYAESAVNFELALAQFKPLAQASPASSDLQRNVEISEMDMCEMLARSRSAAQGMPHCRRALDIAQAMRSADPQNVQTREDLGSAFATLGFTEHQLGNRHAALAWDRQAESQFAAALVQDVDAIEARAAYADLLAELAKVEYESHQASAACGHLSKARAILNKLAADAPADATIQKRVKSLPSTFACQ